MFIVLLTNIVNASNHTKCVSLSNQKCNIQPTLINLHPNKYSQELHMLSILAKDVSSECKYRLVENVIQIKSKVEQ